MIDVQEQALRAHDLKVWPQYFVALLDGRKTFEVRVNDRDFREGDTLRLREYVHEPWRDDPGCYYTGREVTRRISYVMDGGRFGLATGYVVLALSTPEQSAERPDDREMVTCVNCGLDADVKMPGTRAESTERPTCQITDPERIARCRAWHQREQFGAEAAVQREPAVPYGWVMEWYRSGPSLEWVIEPSRIVYATEGDAAFAQHRAALGFPNIQTRVRAIFGTPPVSPQQQEQS